MYAFNNGIIMQAVSYFMLDMIGAIFSDTIHAGSAFGDRLYQSKCIELHCDCSAVNITDCPASVNTCQYILCRVC